MIALSPGDDPRKTLRNHRERGPKAFQFCYRDYAELFDMSEGAVRKAASRGCFDPSNLASVIDYWLRRTGDDSRECALADIRR